MNNESDEYKQYMDNISSSTIYKNDILLADSVVIPDFDPKTIQEIKGGIIAIVSKTGGGKTFLLRDLLSQIKNNYDSFYLFSTTAKLQKDYDFFPKDKVYDNYSEAKMQEIWDKNFNQSDRKKILVVMDDVIQDKDFINSSLLKKAAISARHISITIIILTQFLYSLKPIIRENLRLIIAFETDNYKERRKFIDEFLSVINPRVGSLLYKRITSVPYQTIVIAVFKKDKEKVYKYIASKTPDTQLKLKDHIIEPIIANFTVNRT